MEVVVRPFKTEDAEKLIRANERLNQVLEVERKALKLEELEEKVRHIKTDVI